VLPTQCTHALAVLAASLAFSVSAQAAANRTFVSTGGNDSNTSLNCGATTPCRTFGAALSATNSGGEIVVLTSGGYGPATIMQPVTITAVGVTASVSATGGAEALDIDTTGNVTIRGLGFHGQGSGVNGIVVLNVGTLRLYNVTAENFSFIGLWFKPSSGSLAVYDSYFSGNGNTGLLVGPGSTTVYVKNTVADHNPFGFAQQAGNVVIENSTATGNTIGILNEGGALSLIRDESVGNGIGVATAGGSTQFAYSNITQNTTNAIDVSGGTIAGSSPGTSVVSGSMTGSLATPVNLR